MKYYICNNSRACIRYTCPHRIKHTSDMVDSYECSFPCQMGINGSICIEVNGFKTNNLF